MALVAASLSFFSSAASVVSKRQKMTGLGADGKLWGYKAMKFKPPRREQACKHPLELSAVLLSAVLLSAVLLSAVLLGTTRRTDTTRRSVRHTVPQRPGRGAAVAAPRPGMLRRF